MAEATEVLGQVNPSATTLTTLYTVPAGSKVSARVWITNRSVATSFRVSIQVAGAGDDNKQYLYYDCPISDNNTIISPPIELAATDVVKVYATLATLTFQLIGVRR